MELAVKTKTGTLDQQCSNVQESTVKQSKYRKHLRTFLASFSATLGSIAMGTVVSYTSPAMPDINDHRNVFHVTLTEVTFVASVVYLGGLVGGSTGGFLLDKYGRKSVLVMNTLPFTLGWGAIACAPNVYWMLAGRILTGISIGLIDVAVPTYTAEIAAPSVRGFFGSFHELGANFGFLYVFAFGCILPWNWLAIACMTLPVLQACCMVFMPESPRWLLQMGQKEACVEVLKHFRGQLDVTAEFSEIVETIRWSSHDVRWREFTKPNLYKPIFVVCGLMLLQQMSGYCPILGYTVTILDSTDTPWNPYVMTATVGVVGFFANLISSVVVDRAGRKVMLLLSSGIMITSMAGLASFFTVKYFQWIADLTILAWLPVLTIMSFNFGMALGYGPIPYCLGSELFPLKTRGIAMGMSIFTVHLFAFVSIFTFPYMLANLQNYMVYWILCGMCVLSMVFAYAFVPETKGKSLEEIEMEFFK